MTTYETKKITNRENAAVNLLYNSLPGRVVLHILIKPVVAGFLGFLMDRSISKIFIPVFIKRNNINVEECKKVKYKSFKDFFKREIRKEFRPFPHNSYDLAAPCDGKLTAYQITAESLFYIKNSIYDVDELLLDKPLADEFRDGICLIFRLTPDDYHRYSYIDDGEIIYHKKIRGVLHTARPISHQRYKTYVENAREYTVMQTVNFGKVIQIEVGALFVGHIKNHLSANNKFKRGDEKGLFELGGSTIIMLFQKISILVNDAIYTNTQQKKETIVKMGDKIGESSLHGKVERQSG